VPVTQLEDNSGANLGSALGAAAGYFATKKARDADKLAATNRQATLDKQSADAAADTHANIMDEIKQRDAGAQRTDANDATTQLSTGAKQKYLPMLTSPPTNGKPLTGPALANALYKIRTQAVNEGMTGKDDLAEFNTEIARITQADQAQNAQSFAGKEMALPGDPNQRLGVLLKRQQAERAVPGLDPKPTQDAIAATQKQITEAQAAAYQNANLAERKNHDATVEGQGAQRLGIEATRANRAPANGAQPTDAETSVYAKAVAAKTPQEAYKLIDDPRNGLSSKQRTEMRQAVKDQTPTRVPKPAKPTALDEVKEARSHGIKDNNLIINTLIGNGYTENAARAAVKAAP
jgi:hypothetical protein